MKVFKKLFLFLFIFTINFSYVHAGFFHKHIGKHFEGENLFPSIMYLTSGTMGLFSLYGLFTSMRNAKREEDQNIINNMNQNLGSLFSEDQQEINWKITLNPQNQKYTATTVEGKKFEFINLLYTQKTFQEKLNLPQAN